MSSKFEKLKEAIKNPPTERLCLINARGYILNIIGVTFASILLIYYGIWYVVFAFVFSVVGSWVGYKREMKQYKNIIEFRKEIGKGYKIEEDKSFTRKRVQTNKKVFGTWLQYLLITLISVGVLFWRDIGAQKILGKISSVFLIILLYIIIYLFPIYWLAKLKGGKKQ